MDITHTLARKLEATRWSTAIYAAFIAGMTFMVLEMFTFWAFYGQNPLTPARAVAAIAEGQSALYETGFSFGTLVTAAAVHFGLSILFAWILTPIVQNMSVAAGTVVGLVFGLLLYVVNFFFITAAFPWFAEGRNVATAINHVIFGGVLSWSYLRLRYRHGRPVHAAA